MRGDLEIAHRDRSEKQIHGRHGGIGAAGYLLRGRDVRGGARVNRDRDGDGFPARRGLVVGRPRDARAERAAVLT